MADEKRGEAVVFWMPIAVIQQMLNSGKASMEPCSL